MATSTADMYMAVRPVVNVLGEAPT